MFSQQQQREKKIRNFIVAEALELSLEEQENLIEQLIIQTKRQINKEDEESRLEHSGNLNNRLYRQVNVIRAFRHNTKDFVELFELWQHHR